MAVPGRRNGMLDGDGGGDGEENLFEEEAWVEAGGDDDDVPPHLRALASAAERGDVDALRAALDNHTGSIDEPVEDGDTLLHLCCLYGHFPCVKLLLERGASLESRDDEGALPLHDACAGGFSEIVQYIMDSAGGSDCVQRMLRTTDVEGDSPLHHAARGEHLAVVQLLLAAGASPDLRNIYGKIPSDLADEATEVRDVLNAVASSTFADE